MGGTYKVSILLNPYPQHDDVDLSASVFTASIQMACPESKHPYGNSRFPQSIHVDNGVDKAEPRLKPAIAGCCIMALYTMD